MTHLLNYFPITNVDQFNLSYHLLEVIDLPGGSNFHHNLDKVRTSISREYRTPTVRVKRDGKYYLAVVPHPDKPIPEYVEASILQGLVGKLRLQPGGPQLVDVKKG